MFSEVSAVVSPRSGYFENLEDHPVDVGWIAIEQVAAGRIFRSHRAAVGHFRKSHYRGLQAPVPDQSLVGLDRMDRTVDTVKVIARPRSDVNEVCHAEVRTLRKK